MNMVPDHEERERYWRSVDRFFRDAAEAEAFCKSLHSPEAIDQWKKRVQAALDAHETEAAERLRRQQNYRLLTSIIGRTFLMASAIVGLAGAALTLAQRLGWIG